MRILKVCQAYYPYLAEGGPPVKIRGIARALALLGHRITVLTAYLGPLNGDGKLPIERAAWGWRAYSGGVETLYLKTRLRYRVHTLNPGVAGFCRERLRQFDIVHVYGLYDLLGPAVAWFCRRWNIPYVVEPLGMTHPIDRSLRLKTVWKKLLGRGYLRNAARLIATSRQERQELVREGFPSEKIVVRYNGIDGAEFCRLPTRGAFRSHAGIARDPPMILFLGRLIPRKGADFLIEALPQISNDQARLVIAGPEGENGYLGFLQQKACALRVEGRVLFAGPLYAEAKKAALVDADVFVLPSRYENFGNAAAEAVACGTPVVVSDRCGIAELVDRRAGLVTSYDARAIAQALNELLGNPSLYDRLKAGCAGVAREILWDGLAEAMQCCYRDACEHLLRPSPV
jgi:glycosyltransferase involved in cell wall biosynthesis